MRSRISTLYVFSMVVFVAAGNKILPASVPTTPPGEGQSLDPNSTLPNYLVYAALNSPGLEAAFNRWKAALERIPQARALSDPRFSYRYFIKEVETRVGPQRQAFELAALRFAFTF